MTEPACKWPSANAGDAEMVAILSSAKTIAVVGLSDKPDRDSYRVAAYLQEHGYRIIPVNPAAAEILGERSYADLGSIPAAIRLDVVDIFRKPEFIPAVVDAAVARGAGAVWMQLGLVHNEAAGKARAAGLTVVMGRCIKVEHARLVASQR